LGDIKLTNKDKRHRLAIRRWQLASVLHFNPQLRIFRKQYLFNQRAKKSSTDKEKKIPLEDSVVSL
jgi:hypothetical protein